MARLTALVTCAYIKKLPPSSWLNLQGLTEGEFILPSLPTDVGGLCVYARIADLDHPPGEVHAEWRHLEDLSAALDCRMEVLPDALPGYCRAILQLPNFPLRKAGIYDVSVLIDGRIIGSERVRVRLSPSAT